MFKFSQNIALQVVQREKAAEFYTKVLGMTLVDRHSGKECGYEMKVGPITIWLDDSKGADVPRGNVWFEWIVEDLEKAIERVKSSGCRLGAATEGKSFRGQHVQDPYGLQFHLYQSLK